MFRSILNEKIGNILIYLSQNIEELYLTKALKLLYIIDEASVTESGSPITWLDYKMWEKGPVPETIYNELNALKHKKESCNLLSGYIGVEITDNPYGGDKKCALIKPKAGTSFNDKIFSDYEIELLERVVSINKNKSTTQLISEIHAEGTLYNNLEKSIPQLKNIFELSEGKSNISIEFSGYITNDPIKKEVYKSVNSSLNFQNTVANL